ncbi:MAG: glycosyl hydrolase, partial [Saprospiraceae bacterium]|nr:glycosyl hydrolase [Saprospiraceae bacterium]
MHPSDPEVVFVAALGNVFGANTERGIYRSLNGGKTWERVHFVSPKTGAIDLVMDPNNSRVLYAGRWTVERKPWTLIYGS